MKTEFRLGFPAKVRVAEEVSPGEGSRYLFQQENLRGSQLQQVKQTKICHGKKPHDTQR